MFSRRLPLRRNQSGGLVEADPLCLEKCQGDQDQGLLQGEVQGVLQGEGQGLRVSEVFTQDLLHDREGHQEGQGQGTIQGRVATKILQIKDFGGRAADTGSMIL